MNQKTKKIIKRTLVESLTLICVCIAIGAALYLQALVKQDNITLEEAESFSYIALGFIIVLLISCLIIEKGQEIQKRELIEENDDLKKKINEFEKEATRIKIK